jgi:hypothetical protein
MANNPGTNPGFTLAEDAALKKRLSDLSVSDDKDPLRVAQVFFRHPEKTTEKSYPFITIELTDIRFAAERNHSYTDLYYASSSGLTPAQQSSLSYVDYYPSEIDPAGMEGLVPVGEYLHTDSYVPVDLMYSVTTYTRSQHHDRQLSTLMLRRVVPIMPGRGWIEIPEDGTIRRLDMMGWNSSDILDGEAGYKKRMFRKVYTLKMNAEMPASDFTTLTRALTVEGTMTGTTNPSTNDNQPPEEFS